MSLYGKKQSDELNPSLEKINDSKSSPSSVKIKSPTKLIASIIFAFIAIFLAIYLISKLKNPIESNLNNDTSTTNYKIQYVLYDVERNRLINGGEWSQLNMPRINNWEFKFSEVMVCDEGRCSAFWKSNSDNDKILEFSIISCPNNYEELKDICGNDNVEKLIIESNRFINLQEFEKSYKIIKDHFE